jgi:hypothetical protein
MTKLSQNQNNNTDHIASSPASSFVDGLNTSTVAVPKKNDYKSGTQPTIHEDLLKSKDKPGSPVFKSDIIDEGSSEWDDPEELKSKVVE